MTQVLFALADGAVVAKRNLIKIKRVPDLLVWTLMSPIMFVLIFAYVFGGSIPITGDMAYREYLMVGIFAQTVIFGATWTGASIAEDMQKGIIDRFRSLPMSQTAVLIGRTGADIANNVLSITVMSLTGLLIGWRIHTSVGEAAIGFLLLLLFAYAISWVMAYIGLLVPAPEVVNNASFMVIFPLTFVSNAFVEIHRLPAVVRAFGEWNPVSAVIQSVRELFGNAPPVATQAWSLENPVAYSLIWIAIIVAVFIPLATRQYKRAATR